RVERVWDQAGGRHARVDPALGGDRRKEQALSRPAEHHDLVLGIEWPLEAITSLQPCGDGAAERLGALAGRIAAELVDMRGDHLRDEWRDRMLRLADRQVDRRL